MSSDPGLVALAILRLLAHGPRSAADVQAALSSHPNARIADAIDRLQRDGLVMTNWRRLELTHAGRLYAPSTAPMLASQGCYVPPRVVRREGTEIHRSLPSMRGGRLHYEEQA